MSLNKTESGLMIFADPGADKPILEVKTLQCCHCGGHFPAKPPKGEARTYTAEEAREQAAQGKTLRGWCRSCHAPVCGPACAVCVPLEQLLENIEQGRPLDYRPIQAYVPAAVPA